MTTQAQRWDAEFLANFPKPVHIPEEEYAKNAYDIDKIALARGYRLAGIRLKRAVFSTKRKE